VLHVRLDPGDAPVGEQPADIGQKADRFQEVMGDDGSMTLSSKLPAAPAKAMEASLPMTWATTWDTASAITGLTFPGIIELPGCKSGILISAKPVRGPLPIQRMSVAHL